MKKALLNAGLRPSHQLILEGKEKNYHYLVSKGKFNEAEKALEEIKEYKKRHNLYSTLHFI